MNTVASQPAVSLARQTIIEVCRAAYAKGYISGLEGNFSIRLSEDLILTTPRSTCKNRISEEDLVITDLAGNPTEGGRPSTELKMHLVAYRLRADVKAVVHAHPTTAVAFSVAGKRLDDGILPEVVCTIGDIPTAPYATPSTDEVPASIEPLVAKHDAIVLDHHGVLCFGTDLWDAYYKLETVEHFAQTLLVANLLGGPIKLPEYQVKKLINLRTFYKS
jgi:L-fuculose-phosphate aldolase